MTLLRIAMFKSDASGVDIPAKGQVHFAPSIRRSVTDPDPHVVLPVSFKVVLGADFLDEDGVVVTEGEPGIAWAEVDPTDVPTWAWTVWERTNEGRGTTWVEVPDTAMVEYQDLTVLDPDTLDPDEDATAAWYATLNNRVPPTGTTGHVLTKGAGATNAWSPAGSGSGDVVGPASSVDNRAARFDGTTGKLIQQSPVTISDAGLISGGSMAYADVTGTPSALPPNGGAGGVLSGTYPAPGFAVDMAEQSELTAHTSNTSNPHSVTKTQVGLANVDDVQQQPNNANLTTIAGLTPTSDNVIQSVAGSWASRTMAQLKTALGLTKSDVGLSNVDNTTDLNKPISAATQTALNAKKTDSMTTARLLGRTTASTGAIEEITVGSGLTLAAGQLSSSGGAGAGDVVGPASSTDNEIVRFDSTTGKVVQASATPVTISDAGSISLPGSQTVDGRDVSVDGTKLDGIEALADVTDAANVAAAGAYVAGGTDVPVADGGTGRSTATTAYGLIAAGTTASGVQQTVTPGTSGHLLKSNGASALASFSAGAPADVALGNVNNTSDANKPVSTATQTALDLKAPLASPAFTGTPTGITKTHVGLGNVDNTTDLAKPISTATQTALDLKQPRDLPSYAASNSPNRFDPMTCAYNLKATNMRKFNAGVAAALERSRSLEILAIGDSIMVGTDGATIKQYKAPPVIFGQLLAKALSLPYAGGFCPVMPSLSIRGNVWTVTGTVATGTEYGTMAAGSTMTYTPLHASKDFVLYYTGTSPAFTYQLDGASAVGITPTGSSGVEATTITVAAQGFHTLKINAATNDTLIVGADAKGPVGVRVHNIAFGGSSADWTTNGWVAGSGLEGRRELITAMALTPDLVMSNFGSNDMFQSGTYPNNGDTVVHAIAGYTTVIGWWPTASHLLYNVHEVETASLHTNYTKFTDYNTAKYAMADSLGVPIIDFRWREGIPVTVPVADGLLAADGIHYKYGTSEELARHTLRTVYPNPAVEVAVQPSGGPFAHLPDETLLEEYTV